MKAKVMALALGGAALLAFGLAGAQSGPDVVKAKGCLNCHEMDKKKVGPAFKDVAAKFKGKADAEKMLVAQLKDGKGHPAVKASEADISTMVKFVLAQ